MKRSWGECAANSVAIHSGGCWDMRVWLQSGEPNHWQTELHFHATGRTNSIDSSRLYSHFCGKVGGKLQPIEAVQTSPDVVSYSRACGIICCHCRRKKSWKKFHTIFFFWTPVKSSITARATMIKKTKKHRNDERPSGKMAGKDGPFTLVHLVKSLHWFLGGDFLIHYSVHCCATDTRGQGEPSSQQRAK